ncbi:MAG TPA: C45 family peptidase [Xanthomonadales bacterium]|nr:C45 family peptidase [Xanthomonadales bacterium]
MNKDVLRESDCFMNLTFTALDEGLPGAQWAGRFRQLWPAYQRWWLSQGEWARPTYAESRQAISSHMPELLGLYDQLAELAGGSDQAARFLSMYSPPSYQVGCSQAVHTGRIPMLVRNYDYSPDAFDGLVLKTAWLGRQVVGVSDCMIGLLDGINEDGLVVSLTFGGRKAVGRGFGIPLVLRYILETCSTTAEATRVLQRIPCHMAYNVTVLDAEGRYKTVFVGPDRQPVVTNAAATTNHQHQMERAEHARAKSSVERQAFLLARLEQVAEPPERFLAAFQRPPLYSLNYEQGFGTLYTAVYVPEKRALELRWPGLKWLLPIEGFREGTRTISYHGAG